jgi:hypothetical protein
MKTQPTYLVCHHAIQNNTQLLGPRKFAHGIVLTLQHQYVWHRSYIATPNVWHLSYSATPKCVASFLHCNTMCGNTMCGIGGTRCQSLVLPQIPSLTVKEVTGTSSLPCTLVSSCCAMPLLPLPCTLASTCCCAVPSPAFLTTHAHVCCCTVPLLIFLTKQPCLLSWCSCCAVPLLPFLTMHTRVQLLHRAPFTLTAHAHILLLNHVLSPSMRLCFPYHARSRPAAVPCPFYPYHAHLHPDAKPRPCTKHAPVLSLPCTLASSCCAVPLLSLPCTLAFSCCAVPCSSKVRPERDKLSGSRA